MTAPRPILTFDRLGSGERARLGDLACGMIMSHPGRPRATWTVRLMDWPHRTGPAASIEKARERIVEQVEEWCAALGWLDPGAGVDVRVLTDDQDTTRARA